MPTHPAVKASPTGSSHIEPPALKATTKRHYMVRLRAPVYHRLARYREKILRAKERAQGYDDVPLVEQGDKGTWVSFDAVIERALDEMESHQKRSNRRRKTKTTKTSEPTPR